MKVNTQKESKSEKSADNPLTLDNVSVTKISSGIYAIGANPAEQEKQSSDKDFFAELNLKELHTTHAFSVKVKEWGDWLIREKIERWVFVFYHGKGLDFGGEMRQFFWGDKFIPIFLRKGIDRWFDLTVGDCLERGKEPKRYLRMVNSSLQGHVIRRVYERMAQIDYQILKGQESCCAPHFGKNIVRRDVSVEIRGMLTCLKDHYDYYVEYAEKEWQKQRDTAGRKLTKTGGNEARDISKEPLEIRVAKVVRGHPNMKSTEVAKLADVGGKYPDGTVRTTKAWTNRKQLRRTGEAHKGYPVVEDVSGGFSDTGKRSNVESKVDEPKSEHYSIYEMIQDYHLKRNGRTTYPTPKEIADKLGTSEAPVSEGLAKEWLKETEHIFSCGYDD